MNERVLSGEELRGRPVVDSAGNSLGSVADVLLDVDGRRLTGFVIDVDRDAAQRLHLDRPLLGNAKMQVGTERLERIGDNVLLNLDQREMAGMLFTTDERG